MALVRKVNRTHTPSHCTYLLTNELRKNYMKEGFVKKNCLYTKKGISFIKTKTSFIHLKVLYIAFQRPFQITALFDIKMHNKQKKATLLLKKRDFCQGKGI